MKYFLALLLSAVSPNEASTNIQSVLSAFVHAKCEASGVSILLVLENKTPYSLLVRENKRLNQNRLLPDFFSVFDAALLLENSSSRQVQLAGNFEGLTPVREESFLFKGYEKKSWVLDNIEEFFEFDYERDYLTSIEGIGVHVVFEDGFEEYVVLKSNRSLISNSCWANLASK